MNNGSNADWPIVHIHPRQMPGALELELAFNLAARKIDPKFLYHSPLQAKRWLELHLKYAPTAAAREIADPYAAVFDLVRRSVAARNTTVVGLSTGPALKEARLLTLLKEAGINSHFVATDVSLELLLHAHEWTSPIVSKVDALCLDMEGWPQWDQPGVVADTASRQRVFCFFGSLHNFAPGAIFPRLRELIRPNDLLTVSANLAPGQNYDEGLRKVLAQYDNPETREWLGLIFTERGGRGVVNVEVAECPEGSGLKRIAASFEFQRSIQLSIGSQLIPFEAGEVVPLFQSYRYTEEEAKRIAVEHGFNCVGSAVNSSGEEGVFLFRSNA